MVLEECPTTRVVNEYWKENILINFPVLSNAIDYKYLSLREFVSDRPQKFYCKKTFNTDFH